MDRERVARLAELWTRGEQDAVLDELANERTRMDAAAAAVAIAVDLDRAERLELLAALALRTEDERAPTSIEGLGVNDTINPALAGLFARTGRPPAWSEPAEADD